MSQRLRKGIWRSLFIRVNRRPLSRAVSVATNLSKKEVERLEKLSKEDGFVSKSEAARSAVRLYLNLFSLAPRDPLEMLQLINELIGQVGRRQVS